MLRVHFGGWRKQSMSASWSCAFGISTCVWFLSSRCEGSRFGRTAVTGSPGLGGLGLRLARWLIERGAQNIALMSRNPPGEEARLAIAELEAKGGRVLVIQGDVSSRECVEAALFRIENELGPLRGVVHAAAVLDDHSMLELSAKHFQSVLAAKAIGAWNLHRATQRQPLDFFLLYSSAASLLGSPGQGNYAFANAFLDGLSWQRRLMGLPATSIQWGAFSEVGLAAADPGRERRLVRPRVGSCVARGRPFALDAALRGPGYAAGVLAFRRRSVVSFFSRLLGRARLGGASRTREGLPREQAGRGEGKLRQALRERGTVAAPCAHRVLRHRYHLGCFEASNT